MSIVFLYSSLLNFRFGVKYGVSIRFRFKFFKYPFYSRILVLLISSRSKLKLLLGFRQYSAYN